MSSSGLRDDLWNLVDDNLLDEVDLGSVGDLFDSASDLSVDGLWDLLGDGLLDDLVDSLWNLDDDLLGDSLDNFSGDLSGLLSWNSADNSLFDLFSDLPWDISGGSVWDLHGVLICGGVTSDSIDRIDGFVSMLIGGIAIVIVAVVCF